MKNENRFRICADISAPHQTAMKAAFHQGPCSSSMGRLLFYAMALVLLPVAFVHADLTGRWSCNDGAIYYFREHDGTLYGYAEGKGVPPAHATVLVGAVAGDRMTCTWVHIPKGRVSGTGTLDIVIESGGDRLRALEPTKGFKGTRWTRLDTAVQARTPSSPLETASGKGCASFDPAVITLQQENGRWRIVSGAHWLFDFGNKSDAAHQAFSVIRHYRMNQVCRVGQSTPPFTYLMAQGGTPSGAMAGEDCVAIDPAKTRVQKLQNRWKITSDRRVVYDFGSREGDARQAAAVIQRYGFTHVCYSGRPASAFSYLRK